VRLLEESPRGFTGEKKFSPMNAIAATVQMVETPLPLNASKRAMKSKFWKPSPAIFAPPFHQIVPRIPFDLFVNAPPPPTSRPLPPVRRLSPQFAGPHSFISSARPSQVGGYSSVKVSSHPHNEGT